MTEYQVPLTFLGLDADGVDLGLAGDVKGELAIADECQKIQQDFLDIGHSIAELHDLEFVSAVDLDDDVVAASALAGKCCLYVIGVVGPSSIRLALENSHTDGKVPD